MNTTNNYFYNLPIELQDRVHRAVFLADFHADERVKEKLKISKIWRKPWWNTSEIPTPVEVNVYYKRLANFTRDHHCRLFLPEKFKDYSIISLRALLTMNHLPTYGSEPELIARLMAL